MIKKIQEDKKVMKTCPFCDATPKPHFLTRSWFYGKTLVNRYECKCGKNYNFYKLGNKVWTIPKTNKRKIENVK